MEVNDLYNIAYAMGGMGGGGEGGGGGFAAFMPLILMFVIFYFLLIRPQQRKQKLHREMLSNLKKGDQIITSGGLYGKVTGISDTVVTVEIADRVRVKLARNFISTVTSQIGAVNPEPGKKM